MKSHAPVVFTFVLSVAFILLLFRFRSLVTPLKAIVLNLLSVGAAYDNTSKGHSSVVYSVLVYRGAQK